jgi:hypothetical protein
MAGQVFSRYASPMEFDDPREVQWIEMDKNALNHNFELSGKTSLETRCPGCENTGEMVVTCGLCSRGRRSRAITVRCVG